MNTSPLFDPSSSFERAFVFSMDKEEEEGEKYQHRFSSCRFASLFSSRLGDFFLARKEEGEDCVRCLCMMFIPWNHPSMSPLFPLSHWLPVLFHFLSLFFSSWLSWSFDVVSQESSSMVCLRISFSPSLFLPPTSLLVSPFFDISSPLLPCILCLDDEGLHSHPSETGYERR